MAYAEKQIQRKERRESGSWRTFGVVAGAAAAARDTERLPGDVQETVGAALQVSRHHVPFSQAQQRLHSRCWAQCIAVGSLSSRGGGGAVNEHRNEVKNRHRDRESAYLQVSVSHNRVEDGSDSRGGHRRAAPVGVRRRCTGRKEGREKTNTKTHPKKKKKSDKETKNQRIKDTHPGTYESGKDSNTHWTRRLR